MSKTSTLTFDISSVYHYSNLNALHKVTYRYLNYLETTLHRDAPGQRDCGATVFMMAPVTETRFNYAPLLLPVAGKQCVVVPWPTKDDYDPLDALCYCTTQSPML